MTKLIHVFPFHSLVDKSHLYKAVLLFFLELHKYRLETHSWCHCVIKHTEYCKI